MEVAIVILISLFCSAFFSGMEIAFVSANKLKIELDKKQGDFAARLYSAVLSHQSKFITTLLLGNAAALVVYSTLMGQVLEGPIKAGLEGVPFLNSSVVVLLAQTIVSTLLILVTAEFIPKAIFRVNPNEKLGLFAPLAFPLIAPLFFVIWLLFFILSVFLKLFRVDISESELAFGKIDLDNYLREATSKVEDEDELEHEIQIFQNALDFARVKVRECMIPRTEIVALDLEDSISDLREQFVETGLSKILIYRDNIDNLIGYTHSYELFNRPEAIKKILLPISIVPETMPANEVMELLIKQKRSVAVVVDEFGGTSGMVTMEDVVEEIFGEIEDEHDTENLIEEVMRDGEYLFSARLEIDYLNEKYRLDLPESEDYETLAGLIFHVQEDIPSEGENIHLERFEIVVKEVSENRIDLVKIRQKEEI